MSEAPERRVTVALRGVWVLFQCVGFVGLIAQDEGGGAAWDVVATVGFAIGFPAMCGYIALRLHEQWRYRREIGRGLRSLNRDKEP